MARRPIRWCWPRKARCAAPCSRRPALPVEVVPADIDERGIEARAGAREPDEVATLLAREKAKAVAGRMPGRLVLGADQTLALGARRFSKPADRDGGARSSLRICAARPTHCIRRSRWCATADVLFEHRRRGAADDAEFLRAFLDDYLDAAGDAVTKASAAISSRRPASNCSRRIEGDHFTISGMPLLPLLAVPARAEALVA